ncbi:hypothetical protein evm_004784 [Chilo suppressalis]|nr:hypothetical protein evm_004784 [Chilo suppressalis]
MKIPLLIGIYIVTNLVVTKANNIGKNEIRFTPNGVIYQLIDMVRQLLINGDEAKGVPMFDPYVIESSQIQHSHGKFYRAQMNISKFICTGLGDFRVEEQTFFKDEVAFDVKVHFPLLKLQADYYEMQGDIKEVIPIEGKGILYFEIVDFILYTKIYLKHSSTGKSILIDKMEKTHFTIDQVLSRTEFDGNFDAILNAWIADFAGEYLTRFNGYITASTAVYIESIVSSINSVLSEYETWYILATIL